MLDKVIAYCFYALFFLTPLFWTSINNELFEYNKMILVYGFTTVIIGAWLLKAINDKQSLRPDGLKRLTIKRTPLDIPLLLFLGANILATIFSIDPHTSIWGYYSRSNGGLLSLISYLLLYWAFVSNMDWPKARLTLLSGLASGFLIALWAIAEHFGVSPSCIILRGQFNASCWIQDVQARVFATLGQPNWLAAYLAMLIFPALYFFLTATKKSLYILHFTFLITFYLAFTFTYSRGPTLGLLGGMVVFVAFYFKESLINLWQRGVAARRASRRVAAANEVSEDARRDFELTGPRAILIILGSFLVINLLFGSALTSFRLVSKFAAPVRPGISLPVSTGTQLENGGTESGQIRLIVWKGALEIFKNYPLFGSGLETFAYSYYQYRPVEHNLTSEWDFLYNKAHNEYLNYLATTGAVGFGTYMLLIGAFLWWSIRQLKAQNSKVPPKLYTLSFALLAAYVSYLIYNFFLFSVVIIAVFFYLFPALAFVATDSTKPLRLPKILHSAFLILNSIYLRPLYTKAAKGLVVASILYLLYSIFQIWYADTIFAKGQRASDTGNPGRAYNLFTVAADLNKGEPLFKSELGFAAAQAAVSLQDSDASLSAQLKDEAIYYTEQVLKTNPKNVSFYRTAIRTYFELATIDKSYMDKTMQTLNGAIKLAPTDPKLYYNKALVLSAIGDGKDEEISALETALKLKPNYQEALAQLKETTASGFAR